jgi:hypothetical protein
VSCLFLTMSVELLLMWEINVLVDVIKSFICSFKKVNSSSMD